MNTRSFNEALAGLNKEQRRAADQIDGPLLVIAGPGTGKTQLLSVRAANILSKTDSPPGSILCLTFTDNAARTMRERLVGIIGRPAYHVAIHTFHSFGVDVINRYPDYFGQRQLLQQIDDLGRYELLKEVFDGLAHANPLSVKAGDNYVFLGDAMNAIGWLKQNAVSPDDLNKILLANQKFIKGLADNLAETFAASPSAKALPSYRKLLRTIQKIDSGRPVAGFPNLDSQCGAELAGAIEQTSSSGRYAAAITAWRNRWCQKDAAGRYVFKDGGRNHLKMQALADVYQELMDSMAAQGLYDFDDMVMETVRAMEDNKELRYNLQEQYLYVLVDEFQDTNKAQFRMLTALGDNPVNEGRPNIMAVGDDDQAIYAFQGAEVSNMSAFLKLYTVKPVVLTENYRSDTGIIKSAGAVAGQISNRLQSVIPVIDKNLVSSRSFKSPALDYLSFSSELAQYSWVAGEIKRLLKAGGRPEQIAVIAPRHRYLERLIPYLGEKDIPVVYERRENILDAPVIIQLAAMANLVVALAENRQNDADSLFGQVLGFDFWQLPDDSLMSASLEAYKKNKHWLEVLSGHKDPKLREITGWFAALAKRSRLEPMEYMLDKLAGETAGGMDSEFDSIELPGAKPDKFISPLRDYYFGPGRFDSSTESYLTLLGQLSTLRQRLRQWKPNRDLRIADLAEFIGLNRGAGIKITDNNPHTQATSAVQVMTAYKAKGLEFETVFIINSQDEVWGPTARSRSPRISLPRNLPVAPAGDSDNDKLRLLFVAMTRAKHTLHICGYSRDLENKPSPALSFLEGIDGLEPKAVKKPATVKAVEILSTDWSYRFRQAIADKPALMSPILQEYKLSVTHLNNFIDLVNAGPEYFLAHNLLRFPEAMSPSAAYGDSVHQTLKWIYTELRGSGRLPSVGSIQAYFEDMLSRKHLRRADQKKLEERGREALRAYMKDRPGSFDARNLAERGFNNDGVMVGEARLSGKIDLISFGKPGFTEVSDFKTGKPAASWRGNDEFERIKLHKYRQQLLFYKLLVENSASYQKRLSVSRGSLVFVEAGRDGVRPPPLELDYDSEEMDRFIKLIGAIWASIMSLDFPVVSAYPRTLAGIRQFEDDLIAKNAG